MRRAAVLMVAAAAVLETGCLVQITKVADPGPIFQQARLEAGRYAGKPGRAREVNVLVYEPAEQQLIRVSLPIWLVKKIERHVDRGEIDLDLALDDDEADHVKRVLKRRLRMEDIERAGLGTLVEVDEEDGEQVLVWLK
jgi:hypothetical protein